jgi:GMP synthase (glutamine-hydrolysing)
MERRPSLWIVDPSQNTPEDQGVAQILSGWSGESRLFRPSLTKGDGPCPEQGYAADGVVVMGSAASVYDRLPWLERLASWLRPILAGEITMPVLGICFGHQLIAHLAGGSVGDVNEGRTKHVGVETSVLDGGRLLPGHRELRVVVSHRERVDRLPSGYRPVATRAASPLDGLEHDELPIHSFQFHPEAREDFALRAGFDPARIDEAVRSDSRRLLEAFRRRVLERT